MVQANILSATTQNEEAANQVYNVAVSDHMTLNELFSAINSTLLDKGCSYWQQPTYHDFRPCDMHHSQADVSKANVLLSYEL